MEEKIKIGDIEIGTQEAEQKIAKVNAMLDELNKKALKVKQSVDQNAVSNYTQSLPSNLTIQERFEKMHEFYAKPPKGVKLSYTEQDQSFLRYNQKMQDMYKNAEEKIKLALKLENESKSLNKFTELAQRQANSVDLPDYKKITKSAVLLMEDLQKQISEISALRNQISAYGLNISKMELFKGTQSVDLKSIKDKIKKDATKQITPFNNSNTSQNAVASKNIPTRKTSKINNAIYDVESSSVVSFRKNIDALEKQLKKFGTVSENSFIDIKQQSKNIRPLSMQNETLFPRVSYTPKLNSESEYDSINKTLEAGGKELLDLINKINEARGKLPQGHKNAHDFTLKDAAKMKLGEVISSEEKNSEIIKVKPKGSPKNSNGAYFTRGSYNSFVSDDGSVIPSAHFDAKTGAIIPHESVHLSGRTLNVPKMLQGNVGNYLGYNNGVKTLSGSSIFAINKVYEQLLKEGSDESKKFATKILHSLTDAFDNTKELDIVSLAEKKFYGNKFDKEDYVPVGITKTVGQEDSVIEERRYQDSSILAKAVRKIKPEMISDFEADALDETKREQSTSHSYDSSTVKKESLNEAIKVAQELAKGNIEAEKTIQYLKSQDFSNLMKVNPQDANEIATAALDQIYRMISGKETDFGENNSVKATNFSDALIESKREDASTREVGDDGEGNSKLGSKHRPREIHRPTEKQGIELAINEDKNKAEVKQTSGFSTIKIIKEEKEIVPDYEAPKDFDASQTQFKSSDLRNQLTKDQVSKTTVALEGLTSQGQEDISTDGKLTKAREAVITATKEYAETIKSQNEKSKVISKAESMGTAYENPDPSQVYNTMAKMLDYPEQLEVSSARYADLVNSKLPSDATPITKEEVLKRTLDNNSKTKEYYKISKEAKKRFDENGGIKNIQKAIEAFLDSDDELITHIKKKYEAMSQVVKGRTLRLNEDGEEEVVEKYERSGKDEVQKKLKQRLGYEKNPDAEKGKKYYAKEGIQGEKQSGILSGVVLTNSQKTHYLHQAGFTGSVYGGKNVEENLKKANEALIQKKQELKTATDEEKVIIEAEIKAIKKDIKTLAKAGATKQSSKINVSAITNTEPIDRLAERKEQQEKEIKNYRDILKTSGVSQGDTILHSGFGSGTILSTQGEGKSKTVKAQFGEEIKSFTESGLISKLLPIIKTNIEQTKIEVVNEVKKELASPNYNELDNYNSEKEDNIPIVASENASIIPPSNTPYNFTIENANVKINNGNPVTIEKGENVSVNGNLEKNNEKVSSNINSEIDKKENGNSDLNLDSEISSLKTTVKNYDAYILSLLKEAGHERAIWDDSDNEPSQKDREDYEKMRTADDNRSYKEEKGKERKKITNNNNISDEEIKKLIKENSFSNPNDASGEIYSSKSAVRNYIKYDQEEIKLIGERAALLSKEEQLRKKIDTAKEGSADKEKLVTQQLKNQRNIAENERKIQEQELNKQATGVDKAAQGHSLGWATDDYNEWQKMRSNIQSQSINSGLFKGLGEKESSNSASIKEYVKKYRELLDLQTKINGLRAKAATMSGKEKINLESYINSLSRVADNKSAEIVNFSDSGGEFGFGTLGDRSLSQSERETVLKEKSHIEAEMAAKTELANTQLKKQKGLLTQIGEGFKASFRNLVDYSLAYKVIGMINQGFRTLINTTKSLNTNMLNLRIVTGGTLQETQDLMKGYNQVAKEMGRTTQSVADASNDWLRAGYDGKDAIDLTRASLQLSTLGMIDSTTATTDLISALKGWKLEASEVSGVVDKLTAVDIFGQSVLRMETCEQKTH